jgi:poly(A) polymerase
MREIWMMQPRLERRASSSALTLLEQPRFRAGVDFLRLRGEVGEADPNLAAWWEELYAADDDERRRLLESAREPRPPRRVPKPRPPAREGEPRAGDVDEPGRADLGAGDPASAAAVGEEGASGDAVRRRRRRRRKPATAGEASDAPPAGDDSGNA